MDNFTGEERSLISLLDFEPVMDLQIGQPKKVLAVSKGTPRGIDGTMTCLAPCGAGSSQPNSHYTTTTDPSKEQILNVFAS